MTDETTLKIIHSHSRRKHYAASEHGRRTTSGYLYPAICSQFTWGMDPDEFVRRYAPYGGNPEDHPMCKICLRITSKSVHEHRFEIRCRICGVEYDEHTHT